MIGALLIRVSRDVQETQSQINDLLRDAKDFGITIPDKYVFSEHITGMDKFDKDERKSLRNLKEAIEKKGDISCCLIWEVTRLSRNPFFLVDQFRWFLEHKIPIYIHEWECWTMNPETLKEDNDTTNKIFGYATYGKSELEKIRKRTMRGRDEKARQGLYVGHLSDGYKVVLVGREKHIDIDEERAEVIRDIFKLYTEDRLSTDAIAKRMNIQGVKTFSALEAERNITNKKVSQTIRRRNTSIEIPKSEIKWTGAAIGQVLRNEWYVGRRRYKNEVYQIKAIVDEEQFNLAQELLSSNAKTHTRRRESVYPLKNILYCGKCGMKMYGHKVHINSSYYCSSLETGSKCGAEGICKQNIDGIVWDIVTSEIELQSYEENAQQKLIELLGLSNMTKQSIESEIASIDAQLEIKKGDINNLSNALVDILDKMSNARNQILREKLNTLYKENEKEVTRIDKEIQKLEKQKDNYTTILERGESINDNIEEKISLIRAANDLETISQIIHSILYRVVLYNIDNYWKLIEVTFLSGETRLALYNSRKIKGEYIPLNTVSYNSQTQFFEHPFSLLTFFRIMNSEIVSVSVVQSITLDSEEEVEKMIMVAKNNNKQYLLPQSTVEEVAVFFRQFIKRIERIEEEPSDVEYKSWKSDYKKWSKRRSERRKEQRKKKKLIEQQKLKTSGLFTIKEAALQFGLSVSTLRNAINFGKLIATKQDGRVFVTEKDVKSYLERINTPKPYLTPKEALRELNISEWKLREDLKKGILRATKDKQFYQIDRDALEQYKKTL